MKNVIIVVVLVAAILGGVCIGLNVVGFGTGDEKQVSTVLDPTPKTFTETILYENIETENIITENVTTWDNVEVKSW